MIPLPTRSTRTYTLSPYTTLFLSITGQTGDLEFGVKVQALEVVLFQLLLHLVQLLQQMSGRTDLGYRRPGGFHAFMSVVALVQGVHCGLFPRRVAWFSRNHRQVSPSPSSRPIPARQPICAKRDTSSSFLGAPSGLLESKTRRPLKPTTRAMVSASSRIVQSRQVPTLLCESMGSRWEEDTSEL